MELQLVKVNQLELIVLIQLTQHSAEKHFHHMFHLALSQVLITQQLAIVLLEVIPVVILIQQAVPRLLGETLQAIIILELEKVHFFLIQQVLLTQQSG